MENMTSLEKMTEELDRWMCKIHICAKIIQYSNVDEMICQAITKSYPDLLIFDFSNWKQKEMDLLYRIRKESPKTIFVSIGHLTGNNLQRHMELQIYCSLSSEILREEIWAVATNAYRQYLCDDDSYVFYARPRFIKIPFRKILYFSSDKRKVKVYCTDGTYEFYKKLDMVEIEIASKTSQFIRLHKSYLINQDYIKTCSKNEIKMKNGEILGVSKQHKQSAVELLKTLDF